MLRSLLVGAIQKCYNFTYKPNNKVREEICDFANVNVKSWGFLLIHLESSSLSMVERVAGHGYWCGEWHT